MEKQILALRAEGKSYNEIAKILKCSKGIVSYYCGFGQKEKSKIRQRKNRTTVNGILTNKLDKFLRKIYDFRRNGKNNREFLGLNINTIEDYKNYISTLNPVCYLTNRKINFLDSKSYSLDHIIPLSKGGMNDISNLGLTCRDANMAKTDMSLKEFIQLCKEVLLNNGYIVKKK